MLAKDISELCVFDIDVHGVMQNSIERKLFVLFLSQLGNSMHVEII